MVPVTAFALLTYTLSFPLFGGNGAVNFDKLKPGSFPPYWTATASSTAAAGSTAISGSGVTSGAPADSARWEIVFDKTAPSKGNVFAQMSGAPPDSEFPLAVYDKVICRDGELSMKFKIVPNNRRFKAAGVVWRYQDPQNYYLLELSVDQRSIVLYRMQNGQLHPVPVLHGRPGDVGVSHELRTGKWYETKVIFRGDHFKVLFDNRELFYADDSSISSPGKTGLWTRGGTVAFFDDYRIDRKG